LIRIGKIMERKSHIFDAEGKVLGRMATEIAKLLSGKGKIDYVPNIDGGDFVTVVNSDKIYVTGSKLDKKIYYRFSGYPGGISAIALKDQLKKDSTKVIKGAVNGMLPKNKLRDKMMLRLKVYAGAKKQ